MRTPLIAAALLAIASLAANADSARPPANRAAGAPQGAAGKEAVKRAEGTVRKVDKADASVVIAHGPIENLGMHAMTMAFKVKNPAWLDQLKPGDKIRFQAEMVQDEATITELVKAK